MHLYATIWQILNNKCVQWPETEILRIFLNLLGKILEISSGENVFWRILALCTVILTSEVVAAVVLKH